MPRREVSASTAQGAESSVLYGLSSGLWEVSLVYPCHGAPPEPRHLAITSTATGETRRTSFMSSPRKLSAETRGSRCPRTLTGSVLRGPSCGMSRSLSNPLPPRRRLAKGSDPARARQKRPRFEASPDAKQAWATCLHGLTETESMCSLAA